jgi:soluble lytic murein transglycosylase-like protein
MDGPMLARRTALALLSTLALAMSPALAGESIYGYTDDAGVTHLSNVSAEGPYRLILRNPDDYRVKTRREYRLASAWTEPDLQVRPFAEEIGATARSFGLEPALLHAVITVESNYNPAALSPKGAVGLMQLMPATSQRFGVADPWQPQDNIRGGARYLSQLLTRFDQNLTLALAAYNAGEEAVRRHGGRVPPFRETRDYVERVTGLYRQQIAPTKSSPNLLRRQPARPT